MRRRFISCRGRLHVVDFGDQAGLPGWARAGLRGWIGRFHVTPRDDLGTALGETALGIGGYAEYRSLGGDMRFSARSRGERSPALRVTLVCPQATGRATAGLRAIRRTEGPARRARGRSPQRQAADRA